MLVDKFKNAAATRKKEAADRLVQHMGRIKDKIRESAENGNELPLTYTLNYYSHLLTLSEVKNLLFYNLNHYLHSEGLSTRTTFQRNQYDHTITDVKVQVSC